MTDRRDHRHRRPRDGAGHLDVVERPKVLQAAPAAGDEDGVEAQLALPPPAGLGFTANASERGYYNLLVAPNVGGLAVGYVAIATPVPGGNQADDVQCALFSINESGTRTSLPGDIDTCWR